MIIITTTTLPIGEEGIAYSQTIGTSGGVAPLTFTVASGSLPTGLSLGSSTGVLSGTPTTAGEYSFVVEVEDDNAATDTQAFTVNVYEPLTATPEPEPGDDAVFTSVGEQIQFSASGGTGSYVWSVDGGNLINPSTGLFTAINGGNFTVTVTDSESGQSVAISITIASQAQFCVTAETVGLTEAIGTPCCEFNVECGNRLQLLVPSFHLMINGDKVPIQYTNVVSAVTGDAAALQSRAVDAGATGNEVNFNRTAYFEIVTSYDMAQTANGEFGIGWSVVDVDSTVNSIRHAVVWYTDSGVRKVEVRNSGVAEANSDFPIVQGDVVSFGVVDGELQLWINSVLMFTSAADFSACGNMFLDIGIADASKTIGGYVNNLNWSIQTAGNPGQVGSIDALGVYTSPTNPLAGLVEVVGSLNNANFYVNIRNIQPTPIYTKPQPFLAGRRAHVWVTNQRATDTDVIRIASDGSPDALQNPGMIYLGVLEGSATFAEEIEFQDFDNDEGTYLTTISRERATLSGRFLEVRDLDKLATLMQHSTLYPTNKGVRELGVGGKSATGCDLRAVLVIEGTDGWDVIYMPRVQNTGNLSLEIGRTTASGYELSLRVLPDMTRAAGRRLYSIYQMSNCGQSSSSACESALPNLSPNSGPLDES